MKKLFRRLIAPALASLFTLALLALGAPARAEEAFIIKDYHVEMVVGSDRACRITETLDISFHEERHGIIRSIPYQGNAEWASITDVSVEGAPYGLEPDAGTMNIRIGDPDRTVIGDVRYVISYTLVHADDGEPDADYLYVDLIGTQWDTTIQHAVLDVTLPEGNLQSYTFHVGAYGSTGSRGSGEGEADWMKTTLTGRQLHAEMLSPLNPREGVTLYAVFDEGAFPDAPPRLEPLIVRDFKIQADVDIGRNAKVRERWDVTVNQPGAALTRRLTLEEQEKVVRVRQTYGAGKMHTSQDDHLLLLTPGAYSYGTGDAVYGLSYTRRPGVEDGRSDADIVTLDLIDLDTPRPIEGGLITLSFPRPPESWQVFVNGAVQALPYQGIEDALAEDGTLTLHLTQPLPAGTTVGVMALFPEGTFRWFPSPFLVGMVALALGLLVTAIIIFLKLGRDEPLAPPVEFYPPDGMDPAAVGYVIDHATQPSDITALIFYWASQGHLHITQDGSHFTLTRIKPLEQDSHARYEHIVFNKLWALGDGDQVTDSQLHERFYSTLSLAIGMVRARFTGEKALKDRLSTIAAGAMLLVSVVYLVLCQAFTTFMDGTPINIFGIIMAVVAALIIHSLFRSLQARWSYRKRGGNIALLLLGIVLSFITLWVLAALGTGVEISLPVSLGLNAAGLTVLLLAAYTDRRSRYGQYILERVVGFRTFLRDAEKERLEALLHENPDYYYDILPYAQVLGVTALWADKFKTLVTQPPNWYHDTQSTGFNTILFARSINQSMTSMGSTMASSPQSSSGGGGGGGGFSGGGFSGGGSGGGGGSSW